MTTRPVSENWLAATSRGLTATLERLRADRQLEETLTCGPDAVYLAAVFGLDDTTAIRYATIARQLLQTPAEHDPAGSREPKDQNSPLNIFKAGPGTAGPAQRDLPERRLP
jgi:hypothetical protein